MVVFNSKGKKDRKAISNYGLIIPHKQESDRERYRKG
jgi:hypothetical protein